MTLSSVVGALIFASICAFGASSDAETLLRHGAVGEALGVAAQEAAARPQDLEAQELYVDLLVSIGMQARAEREARERVSSKPTDPASHYLLGRVLIDAQSSQSAYEAALRLDPEYPRAYMGLGAVHESHGKLVEADAAYGRAVAGDPSLSEAWLGRVRMAVRTGRTAEALMVARQGLVAVPDEPGLALSVATLAPAEARAVLTAALKHVPDEPRLHEALADVLLAAGDPSGALKSAEAALAIDPSAARAGYTALFAREMSLGVLDAAGRAALDAARNQGAIDPKAAVGRYPALLTKYPRSALVRLARGNARRAAGDPGGLEDLVEAVRLDPSNVEAAAAAGFALAEVERSGEAEPLLTSASVARPWDAGLALARIRALALTGRAAEAARLSGELAVRFPFDPAVQVTQAGFLVDAGRHEDAYRVVRAALLQVPDPRLAAAFVRIAPLAGHPDEAAAMLEQIVAQTGNPALAEAAKKLRQAAAANPR